MPKDVEVLNFEQLLKHILRVFLSSFFWGGGGGIQFCGVSPLWFSALQLMDFLHARLVNEWEPPSAAERAVLHSPPHPVHPHHPPQLPVL